MDDHELIARFKRRDPAAVEELVQSCANRLLRSAFMLCGNETDAKDLVQDTFFHALQSAHRFAGRSSIFTWLHGILLNLSRDHNRKRRRFVFDEALTSGVAPAEDLLHPDAEFTSSTLGAALRRLSPAHRQVLVLRFYEEMKLREIAAHLGISRGTVKSRLHYAIAEMQKILPAELNLFGAENTKP